MVPSSKGLGGWALNPVMLGSNPAGITMAEPRLRSLPCLRSQRVFGIEKNLFSHRKNNGNHSYHLTLRGKWARGISRPKGLRRVANRLSTSCHSGIGLTRHPFKVETPGSIPGGMTTVISYQKA